MSSSPVRRDRAALGRAEVALTIDNSSGYLPVEFTEVTISRTLFRSGDSEYAINGVACRLLDIQELLSDAGVGRNQHVIASQGQLDAILNARPEERRAIIEEAAGVLKHRKRRERSERRLAATEANLGRVNDLLREVRRQLRPLERQAEAAKRHAEIADELRALRVHLAGKEIGGLRTRLEAATGRRNEVVTRTAEVEGSLVGFDAEVAAGEQRLAAVGARQLAELIARSETVRGTGAGPGGVACRAAPGGGSRADPARRSLCPGRTRHPAVPGPPGGRGRGPSGTGLRRTRTRAGGRRGDARR